jgi:hypothetical protein
MEKLCPSVTIQSDLSILDFDIPHCILFALSVTTEILVTTYIMGLVTWQVLVCIVPTVGASIFINVNPLSKFS